MLLPVLGGLERKSFTGRTCFLLKRGRAAGGLVQGPPGVGKSTLVAALAAECGADLIVIGPAEVAFSQL